MFSHDLCHSPVEYLIDSIAFNRKDRAKRHPQIFNLQFRLVRVGFKTMTPSAIAMSYELSLYGPSALSLNFYTLASQLPSFPPSQPPGLPAFWPSRLQASQPSGPLTSQTFGD
jgi:hypothetical protein